MAADAQFIPAFFILAAIFRNLFGTKDENLLGPLLEALEHDTDDGVREVAAKGLEDFVTDPRVGPALRRVVELKDTPSRVLQQSASTLLKVPN